MGAGAQLGVWPWSTILGKLTSKFVPTTVQNMETRFCFTLFPCHGHVRVHIFSAEEWKIFPVGGAYRPPTCIVGQQILIQRVRSSFGTT